MILIVDDNEPFARTIERALTLAGLEGCIATSGVEALECLDEHSGEFDLAVIDLALPDMHGVELAWRIRQAGFTMPLIAMSGAMDLIDAAKLENFFVAMAKPLRSTALVDLVRTTLATVSA